MLKRKAYDELKNWKNNHKNKCLMVKGARQVGKTFLIREFGKNEYESFIEINFIKNKEMKEIFSDDLSADNIYKKMTAFLPNISLLPGKTLIFFDEIQACGNARTSLKFLAEDGTYDVITSGSLLGLTYSEGAEDDFEVPESIPVGYEDYLTMYSLDFEEFLWAEGYDESAIDVLREYFQKKEKVPKAINDKYENIFREYIVVGGMPEVVDEYSKNHNFVTVDKIQKRIISSYKFDISKHAKGAEKTKVQACYEAIPKQLARETKKFQYSTVEKGQTSKKYGGSVQWLKDSALVHICNNVREANIPLMANANEAQFKLYINDTGLLLSMYGPETKRAVLSNTIKGNAKGGIYENAIAEALVKKGKNLYYFKPDSEHELEFLVEDDGEVFPIEVKAGNTATVSLNNYIKRHNPKKAYKLVCGNVGVMEEKITLPHYMIIFL